MTESEWLGCTNDPRPMLNWVIDTASERKLRLFAVACCRRLWRLLTEEENRRAVNVAERFADGLATANELRAARAVMPGDWPDPASYAADPDVGTSAWNTCSEASLAASLASSSIGFPPTYSEDAAHCRLLRDLF